MTTKDWVAWHRAYDDPDSALSWRLGQVRQRIRETLDRAADGPLRVASLCAGDGRDLLEVLTDHPRADDITALLVEQDPELSDRARRRAASVAAEIHVVTGDAASTDNYVDFVPVDLLLLCGIFGNIPDHDIATTISHLPGFCRPGTSVIWTRHRRPPDLVPTIRRWFHDAESTEAFIDSPGDAGACLGGHHYTGQQRNLPSDVQLFRFR